VVGTFSQRFACVASEPNGVERHCFMKPLSWDKQLGLALPLESAASQSGQTNNPSENETGLDVSHHTHVSPEGRGKYFFLDILFHRMSEIGILRQPTPSHWQPSKLDACDAIFLAFPGGEYKSMSAAEWIPALSLALLFALGC
jgi:hypothetical protein